MIHLPAAGLNFTARPVVNEFLSCCTTGQLSCMCPRINPIQCKLDVSTPIRYCLLGYMPSLFCVLFGFVGNLHCRLHCYKFSYSSNSCLFPDVCRLLKIYRAASEGRTSFMGLPAWSVPEFEISTNMQFIFNLGMVK